MDFKVRGLEFKSRGVGLQIGLGVSRVRSRDRVRGVNRDRVRAGDECVILFEKHPPLPPSQKKWKNHLVRKKN